MKRILATFGVGAALAAPLALGLGGTALAAPTSSGAEVVTVQETAATTSVLTARPDGHVEPSLAVVLAVGLVAGATGSAYLVRRSRCSTQTR